jgi:hypothetical protein
LETLGWGFGLGGDVLEALDVDAGATGPDGQDHPEDETLSV